MKQIEVKKVTGYSTLGDGPVTIEINKVFPIN